MAYDAQILQGSSFLPGGNKVDQVNRRQPSLTPTSNIIIGFPLASVADDAKVVASLVDIVNKVYSEAEAGIFQPSYQRTRGAEIAQLLREGLLAVAYLPEPDVPLSKDQDPSTCQQIESANVVGCVYVKQLSATCGNLGMLALDTAHRGGGLGRSMVQFAEDHCRQRGCKSMQLELLVPTTFEHAFKSRMQAWYQRRGYRVVKLGSFDQEYPALAVHLVGPVEYRIFHKDLAQ